MVAPAAKAQGNPGRGFDAALVHVETPAAPAPSSEVVECVEADATASPDVTVEPWSRLGRVTEDRDAHSRAAAEGLPQRASQAAGRLDRLGCVPQRVGQGGCLRCALVSEAQGWGALPALFWGK